MNTKQKKMNKAEKKQSGLGGSTLDELVKLNSDKDEKRYKKNRNVNDGQFSEYQEGY